jgi:hypothetical protein
MSRGCRSQLTIQCEYGSQTLPSFPPLIICRGKKAGPTPMAASNFCIGFHPGHFRQVTKLQWLAAQGTATF